MSGACWPRRGLYPSSAAPAGTGIAWLEVIRAEGRRAYPRECCGLLLRWPAVPGRSSTRLEAVPCANLQDELHAADPLRHPRSARTGYHLDPRDHLRAQVRAEAEGGALAAVYHSHCDVGAHFSPLDRRQAAPLGEPLLPGVLYVVLAVHQGEPGELAVYGFSADVHDYVALAIESLLVGFA